ncbi:hypothetical protein B5C34_09425 [Pacificimonas flava]|uniref:Uncharacterized protein n=2 Tax=Pacificimonas TaxID=1960290 RepID=A0A219B7A4_9SPHN|nr:MULTISPECIES: hypothetical protein [Pacificimonas]MBZ6379110.1 hypothetical protein [Pacificimonas aurantium]OWV33658.1 hypothetical protein B5C34_09425 [Pacificimonas flava]
MRAHLLFLLFQAEGAAAAETPPSPDLLQGYDLKAILCPEEKGVVTICGYREGERSEYRLAPPPERWDGDGRLHSVSRERNAYLDVTRNQGGGTYDAGGMGDGAFPCGPVGPDGYSGCFGARHNAGAQKKPKRGF